MQKMLSAYVLICILSATLVHGAENRRKSHMYYPKDTHFMVTDFFVHGCNTFLIKCPRTYKEQPVCAVSYSGHYREFVNYCEMQYENCNTWKNYHVYKREKC